MTETAHRHHRTGPPDHESRLAGMVTFAAVMMVLIGGFEVIMGLTALIDSDYLDAGEEGLLVAGDFSVWGVTHLVVGTTAVVTGLGLFNGATWARVLGVGLAVLCVVVNLGWVEVAPFWSLTVIGLCLLAIYAIVVHGGELKYY